MQHARLNHPTFRIFHLNEYPLLKIARGCKLISLVALEFNYVITDEGLVNSIFANCPHLNQLTLTACLVLRGTFLAHLPLTIKYLFWNHIFFVRSFYELCICSNLISFVKICLYFI